MRLRRRQRVEEYDDEGEYEEDEQGENEENEEEGPKQRKIGCLPKLTIIATIVMGVLSAIDRQYPGIIPRAEITRFLHENGLSQPWQLFPFPHSSPKTRNGAMTLEEAELSPQVIRKIRDLEEKFNALCDQQLKGDPDNYSGDELTQLALKRRAIIGEALIAGPLIREKGVELIDVSTWTCTDGRDPNKERGPHIITRVRQVRPSPSPKSPEKTLPFGNETR
jgi:hypothetical protein